MTRRQRTLLLYKFWGTCIVPGGRAVAGRARSLPAQYRSGTGPEPPSDARALSPDLSRFSKPDLATSQALARPKYKGNYEAVGQLIPPVNCEGKNTHRPSAPPPVV